MRGCLVDHEVLHCLCTALFSIVEEWTGALPIGIYKNPGGGGCAHIDALTRMSWQGELSRPGRITAISSYGKELFYVMIAGMIIYKEGR